MRTCCGTYLRCTHRNIQVKTIRKGLHVARGSVNALKRSAQVVPCHGNGDASQRRRQALHEGVPLQFGELARGLASVMGQADTHPFRPRRL